MMLVRPPARRDDALQDCGCERHPRLRVVLWLLWLALVIGLAIFTGHGLAQTPPPGTGAAGWTAVVRQNVGDVDLSRATSDDAQRLPARGGPAFR